MNFVAQYLEFNVLVLIHKIRLEKEPIYLQNILETIQDVHNYNTREKTTFCFKKDKGLSRLMDRIRFLQGR